MTALQIIGVLFALVQCYFTYLHFKRREFTAREGFGWTVVWVAFAFATVFSNEFNAIATRVGAFRTLDLFTILGFIVVLSISFYTYVELDRLRKRLEKAVRDLALGDLKK